MQCSKCAVELPEGSAFCSRCGAPQGVLSPAAPAPPIAEETLWTGRYALRASAGMWVVSCLWLLGCVLGYLRFAGSMRPDWSAWTGLAASAVALAPLLWTLGKALARKLSLRYRLTNDRLFTERGILSRRFDELELIRVDDVTVGQSLFQRWLDVGSVTVLSTDASNPRLAIEGVLRPLELKELLRSQVRARRARTTFLETL